MNATRERKLRRREKLEAINSLRKIAMAELTQDRAIVTHNKEECHSSEELERRQEAAASGVDINLLSSMFQY